MMMNRLSTFYRPDRGLRLNGLWPLRPSLKTFFYEGSIILHTSGGLTKYEDISSKMTLTNLSKSNRFEALGNSGDEFRVKFQCRL